MKTYAAVKGSAGFRWLRILEISLVAPVLLAGCVNAAASAEPSATATSYEPASAIPSDSPSASPSATATPEPTATATATATPTANPTPIPHPSVVPAKWTGIKWTSLGPVPDFTTATGDANVSTDMSVFGWSRGYVAFDSSMDMTMMDASSSTLMSASSADGVNWSTARPMNLAGLTFAVGITSVAESPSGLLAIGRMMGVACGGPSTVSAMWTSTDGITWSRVTPPADFASASVYQVDGGPSGFIAFGVLQDGLTQALWISSDGRTWHSKLLPKSVFGKVIVQGATSLPAGFVVSGAVESGEGCGGTQYQTPSLWWSADGTAWTRATLTGAAPATNSSMAVTRINDHTYMAVASEWNDATQVMTTKVWVTGDGRTWRQVTSPSPLLDAAIRTNGSEGVAISDAAGNPSLTSTPFTVAAIGDDLSVRVLAQTGDVPTVEQSATAWGSTLGPAGLLVPNNDGSNLWLGVPVP